MQANTRSLEENRRLTLAQAYEDRTIALLDNLRDIRESPCVTVVSSGDDEDRARFRMSLRWWVNYLDNVYYQYQHGFIDEEYYQNQFKTSVRRIAPTRHAAGLQEPRPSFLQEMERVLVERR